MNRFTKDMATIDDMLPLLMFDFVQVNKHCLLNGFLLKHLVIYISAQFSCEHELTFIALCSFYSWLWWWWDVFLWCPSWGRTYSSRLHHLPSFSLWWGSTSSVQDNSWSSWRQKVRANLKVWIFFESIAFCESNPHSGVYSAMLHQLADVRSALGSKTEEERRMDESTRTRQDISEEVAWAVCQSLVCQPIIFCQKLHWTRQWS